MNQEETKPKKKKMPDPLVDRGELTQTVQVVDDTYTVQNVVDKMKMLFIIHGYTDTMGSGAERMVQSIAEFFVRQGHEVTVAVKRPIVGEMNGVKIIRCQSKAFDESVKNYDIVFSHLDLTSYAMELAKEFGKPFIWLCHNTHNYVTIRNRPKYAHVVYNAEWVRREMDYPNNGFVLTPPCDYRVWDDGLEHFDKPYITLVNHNLNKGGRILIGLARAMPDRKFLAVAGSYDIQVEDRTVGNIKYIKQQSDMRKVYKDTRLLLMMSEYESWGLVCNEAGASGIPVLSTKTSGTIENMGDAGYYIDDRKDTYEWVEAIKAMDDRKVYDKYSEAMRSRTRQQDPIKQLHQFENWLDGIRKQDHIKYSHQSFEGFARYT